VEHSVDAAQSDREKVLLAMLDNEDGIAQEIRKVIQKFDAVGEVLTLENFQEILRHKQVRDLFNILEIDTSESQQLFEELDVSRDGKVDFNEFTSGLLKLKGSAKSVDLVVLGADMKRYIEQQASFMARVEHRFGQVAQAFEESFGGSVLLPGHQRSRC
jgi:rRNA maturation protein Rpf1